MYFLKSDDAPGFYQTKAGSRVYPPDFTGFEDELIKKAVQRISAHYLGKGNLIVPVF